MTDLLLQPTDPTQYEVIADAQIVGRITLSSSLRNHSESWIGRSILPSVTAVTRCTALQPRERLRCRRSREAGSGRTNCESPVAD
jgi:hypothetical protein